jgi:hypothetical protein
MDADVTQEGRVMDWTDWRPDAVQRPEYPPPLAYANTAAGHQQLRDDLASAGHDPGDADGQRDSQRDIDDLGNEVIYWPPASDLTNEARLELRRCAAAFESTARRLREIVGNE